MKYLKKEFENHSEWKRQFSLYQNELHNNRKYYSKKFYNYYIKKGFHDSSLKALKIYSVNDKFVVDLYLLNKLYDDEIRLQFVKVIKLNTDINFNKRFIFYDYIYDEFLIDENGNLSFEVSLFDGQSTNFIKIIYEHLNFKVL